MGFRYEYEFWCSQYAKINLVTNVRWVYVYLCEYRTRCSRDVMLCWNWILWGRLKRKYEHLLTSKSIPEAIKQFKWKAEFAKVLWQRLRCTGFSLELFKEKLWNYVQLYTSQNLTPILLSFSRQTSINCKYYFVSYF